MRFESLSNTLNTLKEATNETSSTEPIIDGLAIYGEWTTTPADWAQTRKLWIAP
jgi:hypothetical protein